MRLLRVLFRRWLRRRAMYVWFEQDGKPFFRKATVAEELEWFEQVPADEL